MSNRTDIAHLIRLADAAKQLGITSSTVNREIGYLFIDGVRVDGMITQQKDTLTVSDGTTPRDYRPLKVTGTINYTSAAKLLVAYATRKTRFTRNR